MPTPDEMLSAVADSMAERTGRTLSEWVALVAGSGVDPLDQNAVRRWLREVHGVRQNSQWAIADAAARAAGWVRPSVEDYIDWQFTGKKAALRPVFDAVRELAMALGDDVTIEGRGTYVPFVRGRQFAATATTAAASTSACACRIRRRRAAAARHRAGPATHKLALTAVADVDDEVAALLRTAYDQNG